jgi:hypothetical protein
MTSQKVGAFLSFLRIPPLTFLDSSKSTARPQIQDIFAVQEELCLGEGCQIP